jgi:hypothetical protein
MPNEPSAATPADAEALAERVAVLERTVADLLMLASAQSWVVEQLACNYLLLSHPDPEAFLDGLSHDDGRALRDTQGIPEPLLPPDRSRLWTMIGELTDRIRRRVRQGFRRP